MCSELTGIGDVEGAIAAEDCGSEGVAGDELHNPDDCVDVSMNTDEVRRWGLRTELTDTTIEDHDCDEHIADCDTPRADTDA